MAVDLSAKRGLMKINDSYTLYQQLKVKDLLKNRPPFWWPNYGTFEVLIGAVLTQNSRWEKVEISLENLRKNKVFTLESLAEVDIDLLMRFIYPSGLYKSKASYLKKLSMSILETYSDFETFAYEVDREWLLAQKGVGPETADSILCYSCQRDVMVVDTYTARLLEAYGYSFESYDDLQEWCESGIKIHIVPSEYAKYFADFHGMIVEYVKQNSQRKHVDITPLSAHL